MAMAVTSATTVDSATGQSREIKQSIDSEAFLQLLVAQLQYQDPLNGMDQNQFMQQLATMSSMSQQQEINSSLSAMVADSRFTQAVGVIGHEVVGYTETGAEISGTVDSVTNTEDGPVLWIGETSLLFTDVVGVA